MCFELDRAGGDIPGLVAGQSLRSIAQSLNRSPSTISREVLRNGGRQAYRAARSDQRAWDCATRPKFCKLSFNDPLCHLIARKLRQKWSPQQIAGWLKRKHPDEEQQRVSQKRSIAACMCRPVGF